MAKFLGRMVFAGIDVITSHQADGTETINQVIYRNEALKDDEVYRVVTADMFTFGL